MNVKKQAQKDAFEFSRAQVFHGEGAGTRRKLIATAVEHRAATLPSYEKHFKKAVANQNMVKHVNGAIRERSRKDTLKKIEKNLKGFSTGNRRSLTTSVAVGLSVAMIAHETGADKVALEYSKLQYLKGKAWVKKNMPATYVTINNFSQNDS